MDLEHIRSKLTESKTIVNSKDALEFWQANTLQAVFEDYRCGKLQANDIDYAELMRLKRLAESFTNAPQGSTQIQPTQSNQTPLAKMKRTGILPDPMYEKIFATDLKEVELKLILYYARHMLKWKKGCWHGQKKIAAKLGRNKGTIRRWLVSLEQKGIIRIVKTKQPNGLDRIRSFGIANRGSTLMHYTHNKVTPLARRYSPRTNPKSKVSNGLTNLINWFCCFSFGSELLLRVRRVAPRSSTKLILSFETHAS